MILIAHRGNINGPNPERENTIDYILEALESDYDVEIDVRYIDGQFFLGHDYPQERCPDELLLDQRVWIHAKDIETLYRLEMFLNEYELDYPPNLFFHQSDDVTITTSGFLWTQPGKHLTPISIQVMPEYVGEEFSTVASGICSDYVGEVN